MIFQLKELQAKRKEIRAQQEKELAEQKREEEERIRREEADKKAKEAEEKRRRLEEAERKRESMVQSQREKMDGYGSYDKGKMLGVNYSQFSPIKTKLTTTFLLCSFPTCRMRRRKKSRRRISWRKTRRLLSVSESNPWRWPSWAWKD